MKFSPVCMVGALILLAGCSAPDTLDVSTLSEEEYVALLDGHDVPEDMQFSTAGFLTKQDDLILALYGSSSCPPAPVSVSVIDNAVHVDLKDYKDTMCTADFRGPFAYSITLGNELPEVYPFDVIFDGNDSSAISVTYINTWES